MMSKDGSKFIALGGEPSTIPCICGAKRCAELTKCFNSVGDARGCKFLLPSLGGSRNVDLKRHKIERIVHHLGLGKNNIEQYASTDLRNRGLKTPTPKKTRARAATPERTYKAVAAHHFHPEVVQFFVVDGKQRFGDYLTDSFVKDTGLWQNGYTDADYFRYTSGDEKGKVKMIKVGGKDDEKVFAPCPSYKYELALGDYQFLQTRLEIHDI